MATTTKSDAIANITGLFLIALIVMVALGAVHHDVSASVPAVGYWVTFLVIWAVRILISLFRR